MTDDAEFADARAHLEQALYALDKLRLHMAAADVSSALERLRRYSAAPRFPEGQQAYSKSE